MHRGRLESIERSKGGVLWQGCVCIARWPGRRCDVSGLDERRGKEEAVIL